MAEPEVEARPELETAANRRRLEQLRRDISGPRDAFDGARFSGALRWLAGLRRPWDVLVLGGSAVGLLLLAIAGAQLTVMASGSPIPSMAGMALVGTSGALSAHLASVK